MSHVFDAVREALAASDKTRYQLWQETGISQAQLCEFLHGRRGLGIENLEVLADALGLEILIRSKRTRRKGG